MADVYSHSSDFHVVCRFDMSSDTLVPPALGIDMKVNEEGTMWSHMLTHDDPAEEKLEKEREKEKLKILREAEQSVSQSHENSEPYVMYRPRAALW